MIQPLPARPFVRTVLGDISPVDLGVTYWGDAEHGTLRLLGWMAEDGLLDHVVLGMDAARRGYYTVYGGSPGLGWLLGGFSRSMDDLGLGPDVRRRMFVDNPARVFAFTVDDGGMAA